MNDISVDFVGGDDFGLAGHTPLHPMYVSYSALPSPAYSHKNSIQNYLIGTASSHQSVYCESSFPKQSGQKLLNDSVHDKSNLKNDTIHNNQNCSSNRDFQNVDYSADYTKPLDHLQRPASPYDEYDSLNSAVKLRYQKNKMYYPHSTKYSPIARIKSRQATAKQVKSSNKPRIFTDHIREQPLRSFYSDPRLSVDQQPNENERSSQGKRDSRPLSLYASNF